MAMRIFSSGGCITWLLALVFWLERKIYVVPRRVAFGFVPRANIICPTCDEHKKHFVSFAFRQFVQCTGLADLGL